MAVAPRACGLVLVRLGEASAVRSGRPTLCVSQADLVNGRNARIPDFGSIERQSSIVAEKEFHALGDTFTLAVPTILEDLIKNRIG